MADKIMTRQSLSQWLVYKNQPVFDRYTKDYPQNKMVAAEAFAELLKYMWLCQQHKMDCMQNKNPNLDFRCVIHVEMREIDDMWHTFLLFTKDYYDFCHEYFGGIFHHQPLTVDDEARQSGKYESELQRYLSYIYDKLGEATLQKWFGECL